MANWIDSAGFYTLSGLSSVYRKLPLELALAVGRFCGRVTFYFTGRRRVAYADLKAAFGSRFSEKERWKIVRKHFQNHGQMFVEVLRFPDLNREFIDRNIKIHHLERFREIADQNQGAVLLTAHFGNWELLQIVSGLFGKPVHVLARNQKMPRLNQFLNSLRESHGSVAMTRGMGIRGLMRSLRRREMIGILGDQDAGRDQGLILKFLGRKTTIPTGAFDLANRTGAPLLPCFIVRKAGYLHEIFVEEAIPPAIHSDSREAVEAQVKQYVSLLEKYISLYPEEWLWESKRWKYTWTKRILILSDGKAGHVKQSEAVAAQFQKIENQYGRPGMEYPTQTLPVEFRSEMRKKWFPLFAFFIYPFIQGRLRLLKYFFTVASQARIEQASADFIVSAGSALAPLNLLVSRDSRAKSIVLMKPSFPFNLFRYDLALVPHHDRGMVPPKSLRTFLTPSRMETSILEDAAEKLARNLRDRDRVRFAIFIGGSTRRFRIPLDRLEKMFSSLQKLSKDFGDYLITTSRRTGFEIESFLRQSVSRNPECQLLVIANQNNPPETVSGMMSLAETVIVTEDSISMISEAIAAQKRVIVVEFGGAGLPAKHKRFRKILSEQTALVTTPPEALYEAYAKLVQLPASSVLETESRAIRDKLESIL